jgi:hypothetical protein
MFEDVLILLLEETNPMAFNFLGWFVFLDNIAVCDFELLVFSWT